MSELDDVLAALSAAGAPYAFTDPQTGRRSMLMPWTARQQAAAILDPYPGVPVDAYDDRWETRNEKTVAVPTGDDGTVIAVSVELDVQAIDVFTAAITALAEAAGGIEHLGAYLAARPGLPDDDRVVRLDELAAARTAIDRAHAWLDDGPFASDYPPAPAGARTAAQLLLADYVSEDEIPTMGHVFEAISRWPHVIDQGIRLDALERADETRRIKLTSTRTVPAVEAPGAS